MADLSNFIEYDRVHTIDIKNVLTGDPVGIKFGVVSRDSKRVTDALRQWQASIWEKRRKANDESDLDQAAIIDEQGRETLIAAIDWWDWGEHSWGSLSGRNESPSAEDKRMLVEHPNSRWIVEQLVAEMVSIENFMQPSPKSARNTSKKT